MLPLRLPVFRSLLPLFLCLAVLAGAPLRAQEDPRAVAGALVNQGNKAYEAGRFDQALSLFQRSLDIFQRLQDRRGVGTTLSNLGLVYRQLGQNKKAMEFYDRALAIADPDDHRGNAILLHNIGDLANANGQPEVALRYYTQALELDEALGDRKGVSATLDAIGRAYARMRRFDQALEAQTRSLAVIQPTGDLRAIARVMNNLGTTGKAKGDNNLAIRYLTQALQLKRRFASQHELGSSLTNLALIYFDTNKLDLAAAAFSEAILTHELVSREVRDASRLGDYQDWFRSSLYRRYAHVLVNQGKPEEALVVLERGRSQGLARQAAQNRADFSKVLGAVDARRLQTALAVFTAAGAEVRQTEGLEFLADGGVNSPTTVQVLNLRRRYEEAERQLTALRNELSARYPAYRRRTGAAPPTAAELKALAAKHPDTLYLQWAVGAESTSLLFSLSQKEGIKSFVLPNGEDALRRQVKPWRHALDRLDVRAEPALARALYATLFAEVEKAGLLAPGKYQRLVLVGDGPLLEVPFAALVDGEGKRLIERVPVAVSGSFGVLTWPDDRETPSILILVAADPVSPGNPALPASRHEGKVVSALFPGGRLLIGEQATKRAVMPDLARSGILHFSTHGALDAEDGLRSGLLLAGRDNDLLEAGELINMRLAAQLAVLSACDTGAGEKSGGEGLLGLTWAFRAAGCPSIVASLWSVDDAATGKLMVAFYQALKAGKRKDEALRDGALAVKQGQPQPYFWAAFHVSGDTEPVKL